MKKSSLKKIGKRGQQWIDARKKLKELFEKNGIINCELRFPGCWRDNSLSFHHRHKRDWYYKMQGREKLLGNYNQVILCCIPCHDIAEKDTELTKRMFQMKRPIKLDVST